MPLDATGEFTPGGEQLADKLFHHLPHGSVIKYKEPEWVEEAPEDWRVYGRINRTWIPLDVVDVPEDDLLYARRNGVWVRVTAREVAIDGSNVDDELADRISRQGDSMLGNLALLSPPSADFHAVNKQYVDRVLAGVPVIIGVFDATTGNCQFTPASGLPDGPLPPAAPEIQGAYLVVIVAGTIPEVFNVGDWVFCDGVSWVRLAIGGVGSMGEAPLDGGFYSRRNANWEKIFHLINATTWRFEHSLYIDAGPTANSFLRVIGGNAYFQVEARPNGQMGYTFNSYAGANRLHFQESSVAVWDIYPQSAACIFDKWVAGVARRLFQIADPSTTFWCYVDIYNPVGAGLNSNLTVRNNASAAFFQFQVRADGSTYAFLQALEGQINSWIYRTGVNINKFELRHVGDNFYFYRYTGVGNQTEAYLTFDPNGVSTAKDPTLPRHLATKQYVDELYGRMVIFRFDPPSVPTNTQFTLHIYGINFPANGIVTYINTPRTTTFHDSGHISATFGSGAQAVPREVYILAEGRPGSNIVFFTPTLPEGEVEEEERPIQKPVEEEDLTYVGKLEARLALLEVKFKELERKVYALR